MKLLEQFSTGKTALVLGAGQGPELAWLKSHGFEVLAVDKSYTETNAGQVSSRIEDFAFNGKYDLVVAYHCLQFVYPVPAKKMLACLNPGGRLVTRTPLTFETPTASKSFLLNADSLKQMFGELKTLYLDEFMVEENPHKGVDTVHKHMMIEFVGQAFI